MDSKKKAVIFVILGQSNAVGHALKMTEDDKVTTPMSHVWGLHRDQNQKLDLQKLQWSGYTTDGMNLGETQDHTYSIANCLAKNWQAHIDAGNEKNLPDLYIINTCAVTAEAERKSRQTVGKAIKKNPNAVGDFSYAQPQTITFALGFFLIALPTV